MVARVAVGAGAAGLGLVGVNYAGIGGQDDTTRDDAGQVVEGGELGAFRIRLGDCLGAAPDGEFESVAGIPCSEPHESEVFHAFNLPYGDDDPYPGELVMQSAMEEGCLGRFEPFVGRDYATSIYDISIISPSAGSWAELDDREVLCLLVRMDGAPMTGSAAGTGI